MVFSATLIMLTVHLCFHIPHLLKYLLHLKFTAVTYTFNLTYCDFEDRNMCGFSGQWSWNANYPDHTTGSTMGRYNYNTILNNYLRVVLSKFVSLFLGMELQGIVSVYQLSMPKKFSLCSNYKHTNFGIQSLNIEIDTMIV